MLFRLVFIIVTCGIALAQNIDSLYEKKAEASIRTEPILLSPQSEADPIEHESLQRRQSPEKDADVVGSETSVLHSAVKTAGISHEDGSLNIQRSNVAEPGCCG